MKEMEIEVIHRQNVSALRTMIKMRPETIKLSSKSRYLLKQARVLMTKNRAILQEETYTLDLAAETMGINLPLRHSTTPKLAQLVSAGRIWVRTHFSRALLLAEAL